MYKDMRSRVRVGDGFSVELDVTVGLHQGSVLSRLLLIIVLEAQSRDIHTGSPWELLYADNLMISADYIEKLLVKLKEWNQKWVRRACGRTFEIKRLW